jgi:NADPH:quinone reductase-like Zn-dependent oxidoreductase
MTYKCVVATRRGGPEVLQVVEHDLRAPAAGKVRVRVLAAAVSLPDVEARYGHSPFPPKMPFTPGYAVAGEVDAVGTGRHAGEARRSGGGVDRLWGLIPKPSISIRRN